MTVAEYLADQLLKQGVKYVFGIPGGPSIPYMEAFRTVGIRFILTSNEAAAGIMADVTGRLTGTPGVCHATFGPGATNLTTGVGGASLDRSPVIALTSETGDSMISRTTQMNIDHQKLFSPVTRATWRINRENAARIIASAAAISRREYPGPVHIGLPADIALSEITDSPASFQDVEAPVIENDTIAVASLLGSCKRPIIAVGLTAARTGTGQLLSSFLEKYPVPVVVTPMAKGLLHEDNPCYAGVLFHSLSDRLEKIYSDTDLVIGLGYDTVEYDYESWVPDVPLIHFSTITNDLPVNKNVHQFSGSPEEWFDLLENLNSGNLVPDTGRISCVRNEMESVFEGLTNHFGPVSALKILRDLLPDDSILTADVGSHLHLIGQFWKTYGKQNLIITNGWSGMGFGIPAALAARLADPARTVACVTGDGGFLMMCGELITARRYNLHVIIVVFSDGELNLIRLKQAWQGLDPLGTVLYSGDLFGSGTFLGIPVLNADSKDNMRIAILKALSLDGPVVINASIDPGDYKSLVVKR